MRKDVLVILPAFNEEENIGKFIKQMREHGTFDMADVLVINDGSTDNTSSVAKHLGVNVITHIYNLGYGCALQTGYKYAVRHGYSYLVQIDSDGQHDVANIDNIVNTLKSNDEKVDIVIGSRFLNNSVTYPVSSIRKLAITFFRKIIKLSTNQIILDPTSGLQGLSRETFLYYSFYNHFVHDYPDANMIIQMLLNDFNVKEVPAVMHERVAGVSMHSGIKPVLYIVKMALNTAVVIMREKSRSSKTEKNKK